MRDPPARPGAVASAARATVAAASKAMRRAFIVASFFFRYVMELVKSATAALFVGKANVQLVAKILITGARCLKSK